MSDWRRRLYDQYVSSGQGGAGYEDGYRSAAPYVNHVIKKHVPQDRNIRILDLGCGSGGMIYHLKNSGYLNVSGIDNSSEMVAIAKKSGLIEVRLGDINQETKTIESNSFDLVIIMDVLEHLNRDNLFKICDEIFRILRPGGKLIAHVPNAGGIYGPSIQYGDLTHELSFTTSSIRQLFYATGFEDISCYEDKPIPHGTLSYLRLITWLIGTSLFRLLYAAETGNLKCIMSQNLLATAHVPD